MKILSIFLATLAIYSRIALAESITIEYHGDNHPLLPKYVFECQKVGLAKLELQAQSYGVTVDTATVRLVHVSTNPLASYLWWAVDVTDVNGRTDVFPEGQKAVLQKLTQKPLLGKCF